MTGAAKQIARHDVPNVVETLTMAFADDPMLRWWIADEGRRTEIVPAFFSILVEAFRPAGQVWSLDGVSAALWVPPDLPKPTEEESAALNEAMATACGEYAEVGNEISEAMAAVHPKGGPHVPVVPGRASGVPGSGPGLEAAARGPRPL